MREFLPYIVVGLASGSVYGLAGIGLVLTYKTSGLFNFAHGGLAAVGAYVFYEFHFRLGWPWPVALVACLLVCVPVLGFALERLARELATVPPAVQIVATVGVLLAIQGGAAAVYGAAVRTFPQFLPRDTFTVAGTAVGYDQLIVVVFVAAVALGLYLFFRSSRLGAAMRAVVGNPELLALTGTDPVRIRRLAWQVGSGFAVVSGVLIAPSLGLDPFLLTLLVVQAFGAAALGRFTNLSVTYAGGLVIGVASALSQRWVSDIPSLRSFPPSLPFVVLFATLLFTRRRQLLQDARPLRRTARVRASDRRLAPAAGVVLLGALLVAPHIVGARLAVYTSGLIFVIVFLSLGLLVWTSGQISLCHAAFAALGASTFSHLTVGAGLPWLVGLIGAGLLTVPLGAFLALPAIRLSGLYLAVATFGFGILLERMVYGTDLMFTSKASLTVPRPDFAFVHGRSDVTFYYVVLAIVVAAAALTAWIVRSRLGRLMRGLADAPVALEALGASATVTRVLVFCVSGFLAAVAGGLLGSAYGSINGVPFGPFQSLIWLTVLAISGRSLVPSALVAAGLLAVAPSYTAGTVAEHQTLIFGVLAVVAALVAGGRLDLRGRVERSAEAAEALRHGRGPVIARRGDEGWHGPMAGRSAELLVASSRQGEGA